MNDRPKFTNSSLELRLSANKSSDTKSLPVVFDFSAAQLRTIPENKKKVFPLAGIGRGKLLDLMARSKFAQPLARANR